MKTRLLDKIQAIRIELDFKIKEIIQSSLVATLPVDLNES
jgi:hypothetical protein